MPPFGSPGNAREEVNDGEPDETLDHRIVPEEHGAVEGLAAHAVELFGGGPREHEKAHQGEGDDVLALQRDEGVDDGAIAAVARPQAGAQLRVEIGGKPEHEKGDGCGKE